MLVQLPYLSLNYIVCIIIAYIYIYKYQIMQFLYRCPFLSLCNYVLLVVKRNKKGPVQINAITDNLLTMHSSYEV